MKSKTKNSTEDPAIVKELINDIREEQRKINRYEGNVVAVHIRVAYHLTQLRLLAEGNWGDRLKAVGMSPRVASRYLKIADNWGGEIGLTESDLLQRLPPDLLKLEWLCRVPFTQLGDLLDELDCKKATRPQVIAAVRAALHEAPPTKDAHGVDDFVQRLIHRLVSTVERLSEKFPEAEQQECARDLLAAGLRQVQQALRSADDAANHRSPGTAAGSDQVAV